MSNLTITDPSEIGTLKKESLLSLFEKANTEAMRIQSIMDNVIRIRERVAALENEKIVKSRISGGLCFVLFLFYIIPGIIYLVVKNNTKRQYEEMIDAELRKIPDYENEARQEAKECQYLNLIPNDYRNPLALETMKKYLDYGQAETWKECSSKYDEQMHRWVLEQNSAEALELQNYAAMMAEATAEYSRRTARNTSISAASDILSWFR